MMSIYTSGYISTNRYAYGKKTESGWVFRLPALEAPASGAWRVDTSMDCEKIAIVCNNICIAKEQFTSKWGFNNANYVFMDSTQCIHIHSREYKIVYNIIEESWTVTRWHQLLPEYVTEEQWGLYQNNQCVPV
jgi:hypothetical protein